MAGKASDCRQSCHDVGGGDGSTIGGASSRWGGRTSSPETGCSSSTEITSGTGSGMTVSQLAKKDMSAHKT